jgi:hypothetical protein
MFNVVITNSLDYAMKNAQVSYAFADIGCDCNLMSPLMRDKIVATGAYCRRPIAKSLRLGDYATVLALKDLYEYKLLVGFNLSGSCYYVLNWFAVAPMETSVYSLKRVRVIAIHCQ